MLSKMYFCVTDFIMRKKILVLGAGKSSSYLIKYLTEQAIAFEWQITIADSDIRAAQKKLEGIILLKPLGLMPTI